MCIRVTTSTCVDNGGGGGGSGGDCSTVVCSADYAEKNPCNADTCCEWSNKNKVCGPAARRFLRR